MKKWDGYQRGINLGGWFSQCDYSENRLQHFIEKSDIERIASWGLDHVRVPFDYNLIEDEDGNMKPEGYEHIQRIIDWCGEYKLNMVLDLHKTFGYSFDPGEQQSGFFFNEQYQERFYAIWEECARRFGKYKDRLAFELLNEVTDESYADSWNRISAECISRIRKISPDIYILLGSYWNNSLWAMKDLPMPADEHIVYNFHCYEPLLFTHQGAGWIENMEKGYRLPYGESIEYINNEVARMKAAITVYEVTDMKSPTGAAYFEDIFSIADKIANERGVMLYCGEYGVIEHVDTSDILKWYKDINNAFEKYGIGRAAWTYKEMDFNLGGTSFDDVRKELLTYL